MALLDTTAELKLHNSAITGDLEISNIQSFIDDAIEQHTVPAIGRTQFNTLVDGKAGYAAGSVQATLIKLLQKSVTAFAIALYTNDGAVEISDAGIHVTKSEKRLPASDKKILALRRQNMQAGYFALEIALIYAEDNKATFTDYAASDERLKNLAGYINASSDFPQTIPVSAELYARIRAIQLRVEVDLIDTILGDTIADDLRAHIIAGALTNPETELLKKVRNALAPLTLAEAIPYQLVSIDPTGAYVFSDTVGGISGNVENRTPAELQKLQIVMNRLACDGERNRERLRLWLTANKADFETYTESTAAVMAEINKDVDGNVYFM